VEILYTGIDATNAVDALWVIVDLHVFDVYSVIKLAVPN